MTPCCRRHDLRSQPATCRPKRRVLFEDLPLEELQSFARLEPELLGEQLPPLPIDLECLGLPVRAIERQHELPAQSLTQRLLLDERLELRHELRVPAQGEIGFDPLLESAES